MAELSAGALFESSDYPYRVDVLHASLRASHNLSVTRWAAGQSSLGARSARLDRVGRVTRRIDFSELRKGGMF
eukprot:scaffold493240_cov41-Prasinocladus_malaysianus.AAC.2